VTQPLNLKCDILVSKLAFQIINLYRYSTGQHFITTFPLRTEDPQSKWVMRGIALLCSVD
jgi:hypothetical protein